jgi:hypothetical protein
MKNGHKNIGKLHSFLGHVHIFEVRNETKSTLSERDKKSLLKVALSSKVLEVQEVT